MQWRKKYFFVKLKLVPSWRWPLNLALQDTSTCRINTVWSHQMARSGGPLYACVLFPIHWQLKATSPKLQTIKHLWHLVVPLTLVQSVIQLFVVEDEARKKAKTFSIGVAATQVYGGGGATLRSIFGSTDAAVSCNSQREYTELKERRRHLLLTMKASNETEESAGQVIQQEDLQEWLDNLQLRLHQQCNNVSASSSRPKDRRSWNCPKTKSHDETDFLL